MSIFSRIASMIREVIRRVIPYKSIESVERIESPLTTDMVNALDTWYDIYRDKAPWKKEDQVKSLNLGALISSEVARQITIEMKWNITAKKKDGSEDTGEAETNPRSEYLSREFERCINVLRQKLEQGCAAGGMTIKPYPKGEHIYFDFTMDWGLYPVAFDETGALSDVIFRDRYTEGKTIYTRLERHTIEGDNIHITQRAFKSTDRDTIGTEISLTEVPIWKDVQPDATVKNTEGQLFGWFRVAAANTVDPESPMGASVYAKAVDNIREADLQYSRLLWEYEAAEMAIDVDPSVLRPKQMPGKTRLPGDLPDRLPAQWEMPALNQRLFRSVDLGTDDAYHVFAPGIRDSNYMLGLNRILMNIEALCGLSFGTLSEANAEARTATELRTLRQRSYINIADNQKALERCLRDVIRAMDKYATMYGLAPEGEYDVSFEWDDSIITDAEQQMNERLTLMAQGVLSKTELREWYFGETPAQAETAIGAVVDENVAIAQKMQAAAMPQMTLPED